MKAEVEVLHPGLFSSIQDLGRFGYMKFGVPLSGSMDAYAAKMTNLMLQNSPDCAVLEITQMGPKLKFSHPLEIVICGGDLSPMINESYISNNTIFMVQAGDVLSFGKRKTGCRSYLGISGGFQTEVVLKSRSWYEGITKNLQLTKGLKLGYHPAISKYRKTNSAIKPDAEYLINKEIPVSAGPEFKQLPHRLQKDIFLRSFSVSRNNNRMAIQLQEDLKNSMQPVITGPVVQGTVQLTPGGKLIILMRDCQTTGGYPRVLQVSEQGMNSLSQKVIGDQVKFVIL